MLPAVVKQPPALNNIDKIYIRQYADELARREAISKREQAEGVLPAVRRELPPINTPKTLSWGHPQYAQAVEYLNLYQKENAAQQQASGSWCTVM